MLNINYIRPRKRARVECRLGVFVKLRDVESIVRTTGGRKGRAAAPSGLRIKRSLKKFKWETPWEEKGRERDIPFCASRSPSKSRNTNLHYTRRLFRKVHKPNLKALWLSIRYECKLNMVYRELFLSRVSKLILHYFCKLICKQAWYWEFWLVKLNFSLRVNTLDSYFIFIIQLDESREVT